MAPIPEGIWGTATSTIVWCEEDYAVTRYVAEFWNTISNIMMIAPGCYGLYYARKAGLEIRIQLCFLALLLVGLGSWNFHMTLRYEMQLFDELPMLWGSLALIYVLMELHYDTWEKNPHMDRLLQLALVLCGLFSAAIYLCLKTPLLFQLTYATFVIWMLFLDVCILRFRPCSRAMLYASTLCYHTGFAFWLIDNLCCDQLRSLRRDYLPWFMSPLTQFHAWWHLLAGYGAYLHILFAAHARSIGRGEHTRLHFKFRWYLGVVLDTDNHHHQHNNNHYTNGTNHQLNGTNNNKNMKSKCT